MTEATDTLAYWEKKYAEGLASGRGIHEYGMQWMAWQAGVWKEQVRKEDRGIIGAIIMDRIANDGLPLGRRWWPKPWNRFW